MDFLFKFYPQILIGLGIILQLIGGTVIYVQNKKSGEENKLLLRKTKELGDTNEVLTRDVITLTKRISEQSKIIENQITGGDSYGLINILKILDEKGKPMYFFYFNNVGQYPLSDVSVTMIDRNALDKASLEKRNWEANIKDMRHQHLFELGNIGPNDGKSFYNFFSLKEGAMKDFVFLISTKNHLFSQQLKLVYIEGSLQTATELSTVTEYGDTTPSKILVNKATKNFPGAVDGKLKWD